MRGTKAPCAFCTGTCAGMAANCWQLASPGQYDNPRLIYAVCAVRAQRSCTDGMNGVDETTSQPPIADPLREKEEYAPRDRRFLFRNGSTAGGTSSNIVVFWPHCFVPCPVSNNKTSEPDSVLRDAVQLLTTETCACQVHFRDCKFALPVQPVPRV